jgi:hypothetical protein
MVKIVKHWKINFYKNDDLNGGAMNEAIAHCPENHIVIHSQTKKNGRLWGSIEPNSFLNLIEKNYGLYEVITKFPHKVYFDIDKKGISNDEYLQSIKNIILQFFPNAEMAISGSIKETKTSYHIILQNYVIHDQNEREHIKHLVKHITENIDESFDWKVYTKNRNMKIINQSKDDGRVQEIIENNDFRAHCITCFVPTYSLQFQELSEPIKETIMIAKSQKTFDIGMLPKIIFETPENFNAVTATPIQILSLLPINKSFNHDYTHLVARFCYYNQLSLEQFLSWISKKHNPLTNNVIQKWTTHFNKLDKFPHVSKERILTILKHFYPHICKDIHYRNFAQTFELPTQNIIKIETINQPCFQNPTKYQLFNVGMGGGKTAQTIDYLRGQPNFLWIAPNKALALNTQKRFENQNINVTHYESIKTKDKKNGKLKTCEQLIVCLNSLHYIQNAVYDILIIDEIETLIDKFMGDFLEQGSLKLKKQIWNIFVDLFRNAKQVILLDAFITTKTTNLIKQIEGHLDTTVIFQRLYEPQTRTIHYMDYKNKENNKATFDATLHDIIQKLNQGSKLFIFYPYKKQYDGIYSMEQIYNLLIKKTNKKGIFYNADVGDNTKKGLKDVNTTWTQFDFIITNNIITCGVNYEEMDFDYKFLFIASHNTPRDIIQVSYRARFLSTGIIKICFMGKMNQTNTWLNDCAKINCPIYTNTYNNILVEKKAPIKKSFQLFCVYAKYKQKTDDYKINQSIEKEIENALNEQGIGMSYDSIQDIDFSVAEFIEEKCFAQQATMLDKYQLNKYYFKKAFANNTPEEEMQEIWDENYIFFFKRLATILKDENNLFNQIANLNKFNNLFPKDLKKIKLTQEIKDRIFKEFSFKFIGNSSANTKIAQEIYNTYFNKKIIRTTYDSNKHANFIVLDQVYKFYEFAKKYLILDAQTSLTYNSIIQEIDAFDYL